MFLDCTQDSSNATVALKGNFRNAGSFINMRGNGAGSPKPPVVISASGYTGHRKGEKSENLFGKCYREVAINSKMIERGGSSFLRPRNQFMI